MIKLWVAFDIHIYDVKLRKSNRQNTLPNPNY